MPAQNAPDLHGQLQPEGIDRLGLGLRFSGASRAAHDAGHELGKHAVAGYSRYLGISASDFIKEHGHPAHLFRLSQQVSSSWSPGPDRPKERRVRRQRKGLEAVVHDGAIEEAQFEVQDVGAMTAAEPSREGKTSDRSKQAFERLAEPLRREIKLHCYRMLGSLHDAEDLVQETYFAPGAASKIFDDGNFRAWLYKIATNACSMRSRAAKSQRACCLTSNFLRHRDANGRPAADVVG